MYRYKHFISHYLRAVNRSDAFDLLQKVIGRACMFNFLLLSLVGLWLRGYLLFPAGIFSYKNLLHAHSHFAFGGWVMPALLWLILRYFPELHRHGNYRHWRNIIVLVLISAYGMLLSFPFQGYGIISIIFSTLSIAAGIYAGKIVWKSAGPTFRPSTHFLRAAFFFFCLSAAGPFATGPLIAMGRAGTELYYNAIYFYLHFQYNGFFSFIILAVIYRIIERTKSFNHGNTVFRLLNMACIPAFALSLLWNSPGIVFNSLGALAAIVQLIAFYYLLKDMQLIDWKRETIGWAFKLAVIALAVKFVLQLTSAIPKIAEAAFQHRNFIIAYLHLVLLGFVSLFILSILLRERNLQSSPLFRLGMVLFIAGFMGTETVIVAQSGGLLKWLPGETYLRLLFNLTALFPLGLILIILAGQQFSIRFSTRQLQH